MNNKFEVAVFSGYRTTAQDGIHNSSLITHQTPHHFLNAFPYTSRHLFLASSWSTIGGG